MLQAQPQQATIGWLHLGNPLKLPSKPLIRLAVALLLAGISTYFDFWADHPSIEALGLMALLNPVA